MERWRNKVIVITGASSGIGLATAKVFLQHGLIVVGLARRKDKMEKEINAKGSGKFYPIKCDISNEAEVAEAFLWIKNNLGTVNILVNNAGVVKPNSCIEEMDNKDLQEIMNLNVMGLLYCTKQAIKMMKENDQEGHIINICSVLGHKINPNVKVNVYPVTKFAVKAISETCVNELQGTKIRVSNVSPGLVKSEMSKPYLAAMKIPALESEDVANSIVHVVSTPQHVLISELTIKPLGEIS